MGAPGLVRIARCGFSIFSGSGLRIGLMTRKGQPNKNTMDPPRKETFTLWEKVPSVFPRVKTCRRGPGNKFMQTRGSNCPGCWGQSTRAWTRTQQLGCEVCLEKNKMIDTHQGRAQRHADVSRESLPTPKNQQASRTHLWLGLPRALRLPGL